MLRVIEAGEIVETYAGTLNLSNIGDYLVEDDNKFLITRIDLGTRLNHGLSAYVTMIDEKNGLYFRVFQRTDSIKIQAAESTIT